MVLFEMCTCMQNNRRRKCLFLILRFQNRNDVNFPVSDQQLPVWHAHSSWSSKGWQQIVPESNSFLARNIPTMGQLHAKKSCPWEDSRNAARVCVVNSCGQAVSGECLAVGRNTMRSISTTVGRWNFIFCSGIWFVNCPKAFMQKRETQIHIYYVSFGLSNLSIIHCSVPDKCAAWSFRLLQEKKWTHPKTFSRSATGVVRRRVILNELQKLQHKCVPNLETIDICACAVAHF